MYGHTDGDLMENNSYFNHPILPLQDKNTYLLAGPMEYVSTNPLTMQKGIGSMGTTLLSLASVAIVEGKPFMLSEWNEYGEHPFHSTAYAHTIAYACLNDWDGLILYNHHTSERWDDQPADKILNVFDVYNDPAVICQWGFLATVFLKGLIAPSAHRVDVVYTQNDLRTLPNFHAMPMTFLPYVTAMRNVFLDGGETYRGDADAAVNAGFLNGADLSQAAHGVWYAWSPYRDVLRRYPENNRLKQAARGTRLLEPGVHLGEDALVFDEIGKVAGEGDYRRFAALLDQAMKEWGIWPEGTGYVDGRLISDTGEIVFDSENSRFRIDTPYCAYFSGAPEEQIRLSDKITVRSRNERITLALLPKGNALLPTGNAQLPAEDGRLADAKEYILTAMGTSGMDETVYQPGPEMMGFAFTSVIFKGKLYAETLEGSICVKAESARLRIMSPVGKVLDEIEGRKTEDGVCFALDGQIPGVQYQLILG